MKVCFSVTNDIINDQRIIKITRSLKKIGIDSFIVGRIQNEISPIPENLKDLNIKRFKMFFQKGPLFYAEYNLRLFFFLLFNKQNFSIYIANDLDTLLANYLASKIRNRILVYDSHELFTEVPELNERPFIKSIWKIIEKLILPKIKHAYTVSESIALTYFKLYNVKMTVIRNFPLYQENDNNQVKDKKIIFFQGKLQKGRGIEKVIYAMKYIENAELHIAGYGELYKNIENIIKSEKLENKVKLTGKLSIEDLQTYTRKATIGISLEENLGLNNYYALPNKLFNYIQARIPVIVSDFPEKSKIVNNYNIGIATNETNPQKLANIINLIINDKEKLNLWKKNLDIAAKELCWENEEKILIDFYSKLLNNN